MAPIIETVLHPLPFFLDDASSTVPRILPLPAVHRTSSRRSENLGASLDPCAEPMSQNPNRKPGVPVMGITEQEDGLGPSCHSEILPLPSWAGNRRKKTR